MFKVGDEVRRKAEYRDPSDWEHGDRTLTVIEIYAASNSVYFEEIESAYGINKFEPANPVPQYSTITQHKVGPYCVTVVMKARIQNLQDAFFTGRNLVANWGLGGVLQECEEDYSDPEMSHEDMLERLRDRLVKIEGVTQIDIVGVNDGCGVRISLEG